MYTQINVNWCEQPRVYSILFTRIVLIFLPSRRDYIVRSQLYLVYVLKDILYRVSPVPPVPVFLLLLLGK